MLLLNLKIAILCTIPKIFTLFLSEKESRITLLDCEVIKLIHSDLGYLCNIHSSAWIGSDFIVTLHHPAADRIKENKNCYLLDPVKWKKIRLEGEGEKYETLTAGTESIPYVAKRA